MGQIANSVSDAENVESEPPSHAGRTSPQSTRGVATRSGTGCGRRDRLYRELDDRRVFVEFVLHGRGKASGLDVARTPLQTAHLFEVRNGRVCKLVVYWDRGRALADLGLRE